MRWIICTEDFPPDFIGGISSWCYDLADALHKSGDQVSVYARKTLHHHQFDRTIPYRIHRIRGHKWSSHKDKWVRIALHNAKADVIIFANWELAKLVAPYFKKRGITILVAVHGSDITRPTIKRKHLIHLNSYVDHWLPVSNYLLQTLQQYLPQNNASILPMPINISTQIVSRDIQGPLICIARNTPYKGIDKTIELAESCNRMLWLIGDPKYQQNTNKIQGFGICSREDCLKKISSASALVLMSEGDSQGYHQEGLGLVLLEAAALGIPSIGTNCGGIPEALGSGYLWTNTSTPEDVNKWLQSKSIGREAWEWVQKKHGRKRCVEKLKEVIT
jgi:glycosyltransferase involved in cell wall biosynthesis